MSSLSRLLVCSSRLFFFLPSRPLATSARCWGPLRWRLSNVRTWKTAIALQGGRTMRAAGPRWSRRKKAVVFYTTIFSAVTVSETVMRMPDKVGPIYKFEEEGLPKNYDALLIKKYWDDRPREVLARAIEVLYAFVPYLSKLLVWEYLIRGKIASHEGLQKKYAIKLRILLTELGPCFIKLGQAMSIRPDILPSPFLNELRRLCDAVPSFPTDDAMAVVEAELGVKADKYFSDLTAQTQPIAAASLGQVYRLRLAETGDIVAVKVQRPDMLSFVLRDIYIIRRLAQVAEKMKSWVTKQRPYDVALIDTFGTASLQELDYLNEAENQERFRRELIPKLGGRVYIPKVHKATRKVLITEWIEGKQLADSDKETIKRLTPVGVECFLVQLLETGDFHADPHPGNLLVTPDGKLALIDFGLCAKVPLPDTRTLTRTIVHLMKSDVGGVIDCAIELGFLPENADVAAIQPEIQKIFDNAQMTDILQEVKNGDSAYTSIVTRRKRFMAISYDLNRIFFKYPFFVPDYFALMTRTMIVLEGIAVTGDPAFDLFGAAYPYALKRAVTLFGFKDLSHIAVEAVKIYKKP